MTASNALITAMVGDAWQQAKAAIVALWRRVHPEQADAIESELVAARHCVLHARRVGDTDSEQSWQVRLQHIVDNDPAMMAELRQLVNEQFAVALPLAEQSRINQHVMKANASGHGRNYQAGRDINVTER